MDSLFIPASPASTNTQIEHTFMLQQLKNKKCATFLMKLGSMGSSNMMTIANLCVVIVTFFELPRQVVKRGTALLL